MKAGAKALIVIACVFVFVALVCLFGWIAAERQRAYDAIELNNATAFRTPPTETIYPHFGAVQFYWNGMTYVVEQSTWLYMTGANRLELS